MSTRSDLLDEFERVIASERPATQHFPRSAADSTHLHIAGGNNHVAIHHRNAHARPDGRDYRWPRLPTFILALIALVALLQLVQMLVYQSPHARSIGSAAHGPPAQWTPDVFFKYWINDVSNTLHRPLKPILFRYAISVEVRAFGGVKRHGA